MNDIKPSATDYNVKVTVRNGRLLSRIRAAGYENISAFCRAHKLPLASVQRFVGLKETGMMNVRAQWRALVIQMADILNCMPDDIIPPQHRNSALSRNSFELGLTAEQAAELVGNSTNPENQLMRAEVRQELEKRLASLDPRYQAILRLRFGLTGDGHGYTLDEVGKMYGVNRERIRQIELKACEKMRPRDSGERNHLKSYLRNLAETE